MSGADSIHIDMADGHYVPIINIGDSLMRTIAGKSSLPIEAHLSLANTDVVLERILNYDINCIYIHPDTTAVPYKQLRAIAQAGKSPGIVLAPHFPVEAIFPLLEDVDNLCPRVLVMSVEPGFGGQEFLKSSVHKVMRIRERFPNDIWVDGGIDNDTVGEIWEAGANGVVSGSYLFSGSDNAMVSRVYTLKQFPI